MKMNRSSVVLEYRLISSFEDLRKKLLGREFHDRLDKPLAFWALPNDRSSPIALMGRTLRDLLATPFEELYATPGIGQKKIRALIDLLARAARPNPPGSLDFGIDKDPQEIAALEPGGAVDPAAVSEALWVQWRRTVMEHDLDKQAIGRFARSLQDLPRVIWSTPLNAYTGLTLDEIRTLKTHGEKRVRAVLDVFGSLHAVVARLGRQPHLAVRVSPRFVTQIEDWIASLEQQTGPVSMEQFRRSFVDVLMAQVRVDLGEQIARLAETRLGFDGSGATVRHVARRMGLTRARVYQLLSDVSAATSVRWPHGKALVTQLRTRLVQCDADVRVLDLFDATAELFFSLSRREVTAASEPAGRAQPKAALEEVTC